RHTRLQGDWSSDVCSSDLELQLTNSGMVDNATAPRVGKLVGARRLIVGAVNQLPNGDIEVNAHVADVVTTGVTQVVSARAPLDRSEERRVGKEWRWRGSLA